MSQLKEGGAGQLLTSPVVNANALYYWMLSLLHVHHCTSSSSWNTKLTVLENFWKFMTSNKFLPAWNYKPKLNLWPAATFLGKMRLNMVIAVWHLIVHLVTNCYLISQDNATHCTTIIQISIVLCIITSKWVNCKIKKKMALWKYLG